jgi:hypothetical protein
MNITAEQQAAATIFWYYFQPKYKMRAFSLIYQLNNTRNIIQHNIEKHWHHHCCHEK